MTTRGTDFEFAAGAGHPWPAWLLCGIGIAAAAFAADGYFAAVDENERLTRQAGRLERKAPAAAVRRAAPAQNSALAGRRNDAAFPWDLLLREVELAVDARVALLNLDTETAARRTRLDAEARSIDDALAFAERLRAAPVVARVLLLSHETRKSPAGAVFGFTMQIDWSVE